MSVLLCKQKALYVKCCIIANGVTDSQGDTLYAEDIKRIFTSFNNQDNFEVYHNELPISEVSLLENYISNADETIGTAVVPRGSWNAVIRVDNPDIKERLLTGEFKGVSLNNRIAEKCRGNLTGNVRYQDVGNAECFIPLFISFVEAGANGYGLHVMDYPAYVMKSKSIELNNGADDMDLKEFLDGLKSLIKQAEDTPEEEAPAVEKEDEDPQPEEEPVVEKSEEEEEAATEEEVVDETSTEEEPVEEEEATVEKAEDDFDARLTRIEEMLAKAFGEQTEEEAETPDPEVEEEDEDTPKITKSEKVVITSENISQTNYYEMTNRDPITGIKIRK